LIYSLVDRRVEDGAWTGISRWDFMLRRIFPGLASVTKCPAGLRPGEDIVIAPNHLSLLVPVEVKTVVPLQGSAPTHFARDKAWRTPETAKMTRQQILMFSVNNRTFVAPSAFMVKRFRADCGLNGHFNPPVIVNWVDPIPRLERAGKPKIIGDWRDHNKGASAVRKLAAACPQWDFEPLNYQDEAGRLRRYGEASLYLCLSLSEGSPYSVCDAEAAALPIVTTDVGNYLEFQDAEVLSYAYRDSVGLVASAIERKLRVGRRLPSYFESYTFDRWRSDWARAIA
jgi:hypothetical protein